MDEETVKEPEREKETDRKQWETEQLLNFCCEMGKQLIRNGAEIYRVEESADRMLDAYGYRDTEVFAIPSCIIINIQGSERNHTKSVRIRSSSNNLDQLDRLNALCRRVCEKKPAVEDAMEELKRIVGAPPYSQLISYLAYGFVATCFTLFWGGTALDALAAFPCGLVVKVIVGYMSKVNANVFFTNVTASVFLALIPLALFYLGCPLHTDKIIIGSIMLLVPGIAITNVMRDVLSGDFLTALTKFAEVMIVAMAIAIGIAIPVGIGRMLFGVI
ncbi:threonine/serine exporter family protein [Oscillibacter hominis]|uniref:Threonine/serine exporter family protein n=1 Tax=Oscillibacter hominis TaxID=2763056 RepID=A0A7G9B4J2_9FIRM|nr:threonine/serine exporter family protein [Oscillibacter hominis]QNL44473.1 threonine/serine exporter family protein [Oscillibacter hominis]